MEFYFENNHYVHFFYLGVKHHMPFCVVSLLQFFEHGWVLQHVFGYTDVKDKMR